MRVKIPSHELLFKIFSLPCVNDIDSFIDVINTNNRKNRAKEFVSHQARVIVIHISDNGGCYVQIGLVAFASDDYVSARFVGENVMQTIPVTFRNDACVTLVLFGVTMVEILNGSFKSFGECRQLFSFNQYIVGSNTDLIDRNVPFRTTTFKSSSAFISAYLT